MTIAMIAIGSLVGGAVIGAGWVLYRFGKGFRW